MTEDAFVDTSILVRYLTGDPPDQAERAARILDGGAALVVTDVVLAETAYVLTRVYRVPRDVVVDQLVGLVQKRNVAVMGIDKGITLQALLLCRPSGRVSFADALLWASARSSGAKVIYSLDARFPSTGVEVRSTP